MRRAHRVLLGVVDQGLYAVSNFAAILFAARFTSVEEFGLVAVAISATMLTTLAERAVVGEPIGIGGGGELDRQRVGEALGSVTVLGIGTAGLAVGLGVGLRGTDTGVMALWGGMSVTGVLLSDAVRYIHAARGAAVAALKLDAWWLGLQAIAMLVLTMWSPIDGRAWLAYLAWAAPATPIAIIELTRVGAKPYLGGASTWFRRQRRVAGGLLADYSIMQGLAQILTLAIASVVGLGAAGAFKGAQTLFGPFRVFNQAAGLVAVPEAVRLRREGRWTARRMSQLAAGAFGLAVGVVWYMFMLEQLPVSLGRALLGASWEDTRDLIRPFGLLTVIGTVAIAPLVVLRAARRTGLVAFGRLLGATSTLSLAIVAIDRSGASGVVWAMVGGSIVALTWWTAGAARHRNMEAEHEAR